MNKANEKIEDLSDEELIARVKKDACSSSYSEICKRYENIFYKICHRYKTPLESVGLDPVDVFSDRDTIFLTCIEKFDPSKNTKFSTWAGNYTRYYCLTLINRRKRIVSSEDEEAKEFLETFGQLDSYHEGKNDPKENVAFFFSSLTNQRHKQVLRLRYYNEPSLTWKEIAAILDVSVQTAISLHNKAIKSLKGKITSKTNI